jgi:AcrR family transcriptional regulator
MTNKKRAKSRGGPGRLSAEEAAKLPDRLLDAAFKLFSERGYGDTSMEQIARLAGASTKTLYARYSDKATVLQAVVDRIIERSLAATGFDTSDPGRDPRSYIIALGTDIVTNIGGVGAGLIQVAFSEARRFPAITKMYNTTLAHGRGIFSAALKSWRAAGLLPDLKDPEMAAILLVSMLTDMQRIRTAMGEPMSEAEIGEYIPYATDIFLRGCGYRPKT